VQEEHARRAEPAGRVVEDEIVVVVGREHLPLERDQPARAGHPRPRRL
jgi:hypothetical protein